jgi:magnesium-transporting ATPase (P-type)
MKIKTLLERFGQKSKFTRLAAVTVVLIWALAFLAATASCGLYYVEKSGRALEATPPAHIPAIVAEPVAIVPGTMTFVSLVLIQFFKACNFRSDRHSVIDRPLANKWLNLAILWELLLLTAIIYVPFLQVAFGTFSLTIVDWAIIIGLASSVSPVLEFVKWLERRGWFGGSVDLDQDTSSARRWFSPTST